MSAAGSTTVSIPILAKVITHPLGVVTWAGEGLNRESLLLGFEDGWICECGLNEEAGELTPFRSIEDGESVNGIAHARFDDRLFIAVSSRCEVRIHSFSKSGHPFPLTQFDFGAHGIYSTAHNGFIAPLGQSGVIRLQPDHAGILRATKIHGDDHSGYFYELASLGQLGTTPEEIFVAARRSGDTTLIGLSKDTVVSDRTYPILENTDADIVSVCSIGDETHPRAFACLELNRTIHCIPSLDPSTNRGTLTIPDSVGTAYKILSARGHLLVLTSSALYVAEDLSRRFLSNEISNEPLKCLVVPIEAIDINLAFGRWILILTAKGLLRMDLQAFPNHEKVDGLNDEQTGVPKTAFPEIDSTPQWNDLLIPSSMNISSIENFFHRV